MRDSMRELLRRAKRGLKEGASWVWQRRLRVATVLLVLALVAPRPVKSQFLDPCCAILSAGLATISSTLSSVIGGGLNSILSVDQTIQNFEQSVVWPQQLVAQAQALVGSLQGVFNQIESVMNVPVNSATLPTSQQLEQNLLSRDTGQISNTGANFTAVYGQLPTSTQASPQSRNLMDMADAVAQDAMKRAIEIDNLADLELQAADQINQSIQTAAPGSAPIIEAQADAWLVRANAYTQAATADLMRVRAAALADRSADMKLGATNTTSFQEKLQKMLQPKQ
jgi:hypothetical protein